MMLLAIIQQSALQPAADQAGRISGLWWVYLTVLGTIWGLVMAAVIVGALRRRPAEMPDRPLAHPMTEKNVWRVIHTAIGLTVVILFALLLSDFFIDRALSSPAPDNALKIKLTAHQWWWEARYLGAKPSDTMVTANELHLPLGVPVEIELDSVDVIHSFWIPSLHGKRDLIPGHPTSTWFTPRKTGTYYGLCAEFCGLQHAHMRLAVTVESPEQFKQWYAHQLAEAPEPKAEPAQRGEQIVLTGTCAICHSIQGTTARGTVGPDLTHFMSRQWIGAGALPNDRGSLAAWILDPQGPKPGNLMPSHSFSDADLNALLDYLQTLN